jgi:hypothetical protein
MGDGMISTIHILGFLMEVQEGRKGQRRAHNFICSLGEIERELWHEVRLAWAHIFMERGI